MGKREYANYQYFLLFLQYFKKLLSQGSENQELFGKGLGKNSIIVGKNFGFEPN